MSHYIAALILFITFPVFAALGAFLGMIASKYIVLFILIIFNFLENSMKEPITIIQTRREK